MKLIFSSIFLCLLLQPLYARDIILLSGKVSSLDRLIILKVLTRNIGIHRDFIKDDFNNVHCRKRQEPLIQLCFRGRKFKVIHEKKEALSNTLGRIIERAHHNKVKLTQLTKG